MTDLSDLLTWRESSTSGAAIEAALGAADQAPSAVRDLLASAERIVITGAGSSYYLAQAVAAMARATLRRDVLAVPLSEVILRPDGVLIASDGPRELVIIISRSGSTSEAVAVAEQMRRAGHPTLAVTCRGDSPLAAHADLTLVSPAGDEVAIVMTRSFASMLALLLAIVAAAAQDQVLAADLRRLPGHWREASEAAEVGRGLGATPWSRVVVLGGGPAIGIAAEWGLKLTETSQVATSAYEPLELRHGPISVCEPGVLVVGLVSGAGFAEEIAVVEEAARFGATTWLIADDEAARGRAEAVSIVGRGIHPFARLPLLLHPGHALALTIALARGRDPDSPRHLGQVVILGAD